MMDISTVGEVITYSPSVFQEEPAPSRNPTITLYINTPPSGNAKSRTNNGRYYSDPEVVRQEDIIKAQVQKAVDAAGWTVSPDDRYHLTYSFGLKSLLSLDSDNLEKITNDCLRRTTQRQMWNKKHQQYYTKTKVGGNAIWDDNRIISHFTKKTEDVPGLTIITIEKIQVVKPKKPRKKKKPL